MNRSNSRLPCLRRIPVDMLQLTNLSMFLKKLSMYLNDLDITLAEILKNSAKNLGSWKEEILLNLVLRP